MSMVGVLALSACGATTTDDITVGPGKGWPAAYHDGRASGTSPVVGSRKVTLNWARPLGGPIAQPVTIGPDGQMFVTTRTATCSIYSLQMATGRKRFCNPITPDSPMASAVSAPTAVDGTTNVYVGDDGSMNSFNYLGQPRWRTPVAGVPIAAQFTADGNLLSITQTGQVDVLNRQTGARVTPTLQLLGEPDPLAVPDLIRPASAQGMDDCRLGGPQCPVATNAAVDPRSGRIYVTLWQPGHPAAALVALRYHDGKVEREWFAEMLTRGASAGPTLSADGRTVYVGDNSARLIAVDTASGATRWVRQLEFVARGGISVAEDGRIIPAGDDGYLLALRDAGDRAENLWERKDLALRGTPVQTAGNTGYTVAAIGDGLNLITFDTKSGATVDSELLPDALGSTTGPAIGPQGEVVVATRIGEVFVFKPNS
ncbi:cell surface protein [Nocardia panacis]|uniref:Cell surface protein n=2 Tax=Nocardia panacis TaxID=2340916 RepID=A0A3A4K8D4_9NOCA|nr:cell surface protein [Nocardia panacis]